jgi:predicted flap endonuclease-1-like 5' DNA nuclease
MDSTAVKSLMRLKGVGEASAQRLVEAGLDSFAKLAASGEEVLRAIKGLNPRSISTILAEAREKVAQEPVPTPEAGAGKPKRLARVRELIVQLQSEVAALAVAAGEGQEPADEKKVAALQKEAAKLAKVLGKLEAVLPARLKRTGKALAKADSKLAELEGCGPKKTASALKKARKSLKKALD